MEQTYHDQKEQLVLTNTNLEGQTQALHAQIEDWKGQLELAKCTLNKPTQVIHVRIHSMLKEFEELLLNNILLKVQN